MKSRKPIVKFKKSKSLKKESKKKVKSDSIIEDDYREQFKNMYKYIPKITKQNNER